MRRLELTLYVYPRTFGGSQEPEEHFKSAIGAVLHFKPEARVDRAVAMPLPLGATDVPGYNAFLHWAEPTHDAGSFLLLVPHGERFFKLRVTFELDGSAEPMRHAWSQAQRFLRSLDMTREVGRLPPNKRLQLTLNSSFQSIRSTVLAAGAVTQRWRSALLGAAEPPVR